MLEAIEKLLILQDRDRTILKVNEELAHIPQERSNIETRSGEAKAQLERAKQSAHHLESERKELELEVQAKKQLIEKYSVQQFQTKKNEEYRALAKEIENCKQLIAGIEDKELDLMEKIEAAQREVKRVQVLAAEAKKLSDSRLSDLSTREANLRKEWETIKSDREQMAQAVDESIRSKYERLFKSKGGNVVTGIEHGVCGGCHMQLSRQTVVSCQAEQELVTCINCGRLLYFTPDMNMATAD